MQVKTFRGASLQEALRHVREELGPEASVLQTREVKPKRVFGRAAESVIEVEACIEDDSQSGAMVQSPLDPNPASLANTATSTVAASEQYTLALVKAGLSEQRATAVIHQAIARTSSDDSPQEDLARQEWFSLVCHEMAADLKVGGHVTIDEGQPQLVAFVGPAGNGKTSLLSKVASRLRQQAQNCELGLLTFDTRRPGAVDQLLHQADRLGATLEVLSSPKQVKPSLERLKQCDVVLADTAGISPKETTHSNALAEFTAEAGPQATYLVLNGTASHCNAQQAIDRFQLARPTHLAITKLDEAIDFGSWFSLLSESDLPVSYCSHGQDEMDSLQLPNAMDLARWLASGSMSGLTLQREPKICLESLGEL